MLMFVYDYECYIQITSKFDIDFLDCKSFKVSHTICKIGIQKAPVFPLPVSAAIKTSPPPRINGIASACTSVGSLKNKVN
jgi:hypothetical protein